jgi:hypothetical protein
MSTILLKHILSNNGEAGAADVIAARRLLTNIQQRHPTILEKVVEEVGSEGDDSMLAVEDAIVSLSAVSMYCKRLPNLYLPLFLMERRLSVHKMYNRAIICKI